MSRVASPGCGVRIIVAWTSRAKSVMLAKALSVGGVDDDGCCFLADQSGDELFDLVASAHAWPDDDGVGCANKFVDDHRCVRGDDRTLVIDLDSETCCERCEGEDGIDDGRGGLRF